MLLGIWILPEWAHNAQLWLKELHKIPSFHFVVYTLDNVHVKETAGIQMASALFAAPQQMEHVDAMLVFGAPLVTLAMNGFVFPLPLKKQRESDVSSLVRLRRIHYKQRKLPAILVTRHQPWNWAYRKWLESFPVAVGVVPPLLKEEEERQDSSMPPHDAVIWDMKCNTDEETITVTWVELQNGQFFQRKEKMLRPVIAFWPTETKMSVSSLEKEGIWTGLMPRQDIDQEETYPCIQLPSWDLVVWLKPGAHFTNGNNAQTALLLDRNWRVVPSSCTIASLTAVEVFIAWIHPEEDQCPLFSFAIIHGQMMEDLEQVFTTLEYIPFVDCNEHDWALLEYVLLTKNRQWPYAKVLTSNPRFVFDMAKLVGGIPLAQLHKTSNMEHFAAMWICHQTPKFPAYPVCRSTPPETTTALTQLVPSELRYEILQQVPLEFKMNKLSVGDEEMPTTCYAAQLARLAEKCPQLLPQINKIRYANYKPATGGFFELKVSKRICRDRKREIDIRRAYPTIIVRLKLSPDKGNSLCILMEELLHKRDNAESEEERKAAKLLSVHGYAWCFWYYPVLAKHITAQCRRFAHQMMYAAGEHCQVVVTDGIIVCEHAAEQILSECKKVLPKWIELETKTFYDHLVLFGVNSWSWLDAQTRSMKSKGLACEASNTSPIVADYERERLAEITRTLSGERFDLVSIDDFVQRLTANPLQGRMVMKIKRKSASEYKDMFWEQHLAMPWRSRKGKLFYWYSVSACDETQKNEHALELTPFIKLDIERYTAQLNAIDKSIKELPAVQCRLSM